MRRGGHLHRHCSHCRTSVAVVEASPLPWLREAGSLSVAGVLHPIQPCLMAVGDRGRGWGCWLATGRYGLSNFCHVSRRDRSVAHHPAISPAPVSPARLAPTCGWNLVRSRLEPGILSDPCWNLAGTLPTVAEILQDGARTSAYRCPQ